MSEIPYAEGEKVLCYHGPLLYEAKCLKHRLSKENANEYMIHYQGWNKNWDEWVPDTRILKYNTTNLAKQKELQESHKDQKKKSKGKKLIINKDGKSNDTKSEGSTHDPDSRSSTPSVEGRPRIKRCKRSSKDSSPPPQSAAFDLTSDPTPIEPTVLVKGEIEEREQSIETVTELSQPCTQPVEVIEPIELIPVKKIKKEPVLQLSDIKFNKQAILSNPENANIIIPDNLQKWLVDDWYQVTKLKRLVNLPATITVSNIVNEYYDWKIASNPCSNIEEQSKLTSELKDYFNICLGSFLLFKCERPQYADVLEAYPNCGVSTIYGSHHFLRLILKSSMIFESLPEGAVFSCINAFHDILEFLSLKESVYFSTDNYGISPPEYYRRAI